jgi:dephospho-CoA kinase
MTCERMRAIYSQLRGLGKRNVRESFMALTLCRALNMLQIMHLCIIGLPGSGKTTLADKLKERIGDFWVMHGDEYIDENKSEYERMQQETEGVANWVFEQALGLHHAIQAALKVDTLVVITLPRGELRSRLTQRGPDKKRGSAGLEHWTDTELDRIEGFIQMQRIQAQELGIDVIESANSEELLAKLMVLLGKGCGRE